MARTSIHPTESVRSGNPAPQSQLTRRDAFRAAGTALAIATAVSALPSAATAGTDPLVALWDEFRELHRQMDARAADEGQSDDSALFGELARLADRADLLDKAIRHTVPTTNDGMVAKFAWSVGALDEEFTDPEHLSAEVQRDFLLTLRDAKELLRRL